MTLGLVASIVVGAALLLAGGAKIASGKEWPIQARALRAPESSIVVLPWIEIVVGALLSVRVARPVPAVAAASLLVAFSALLVVRLSQGQRPPCACFGSWSPRPIGWRHLARNAVLIGASIVAIFVS